MDLFLFSTVMLSYVLLLLAAKPHNGNKIRCTEWSYLSEASFKSLQVGYRAETK